MNKEPVISDLIARTARSDKKAFEELYRQTYRQVFSFLLSLTADQESARDIMQETYLKVYLSAGQYRDKGNPLAWIMTIGKNIFLMEKRRSDNNIVYIEDNEESVAKLSFDGISDIEARETLEVMFEVLDAEDRCIVVLHDISGFKHREIAELMKLPVGTVLSRYERAMKKMRRKAQKMGITGEDVQNEQ